MAGGNYELVAMGNPLLDMTVRDGEEVLKKVGVDGLTPRAELLHSLTDALSPLCIFTHSTTSSE